MKTLLIKCPSERQGNKVFSALFALPIVRQIGGALLIVAAIGSIAFAIYHAGTHAGAAAEAGKEVEAATKQFELIRSNLQAQLDAGKAREDRLTALAEQYASLVVAANQRIQTAQTASTKDAAKVQAIPDTGLRADVELKLGGSLDHPETMRKADEIITDYPHKLEEISGLNDKVAAEQNSLDTANQQAANAQSERDAALGAFNQILPLYTQARNAAIQGHRKWYCLFLCKKKNMLNLPEPATLFGKISQSTGISH
jgi:hypothetical protein